MMFFQLCRVRTRSYWGLLGALGVVVFLPSARSHNDIGPVRAIRITAGTLDEVFDLQPWPMVVTASARDQKQLKASSWAVPLMSFCQKLKWDCHKTDQEFKLRHKNLSLIYLKNQDTVEISGLQMVLKEPLFWTPNDVLAPISFIDQVINSLLEFPIIRIRSEAYRWQESWVISSSFFNFLRWLKKPAHLGKKMNVVLDPGHGGEETGTKVCGVGDCRKNMEHMIYEKDLTLRYAHAILVMLARETDWNIFLTRNRDTALTLYERAQQANQIPADLLISIHFNHSTSPKIRGIEVHYNAFPKKPLELEKRLTPAAWNTLLDEQDLQNNRRYFEYVDHKTIEQSVKKSKELGQILAQHLSRNEQMPFRQMQANDLAVLNHSYYPALLIELGYLSNPLDRNYLTSEKGLEQISKNIVQAIKDYWLKQKETVNSVVLNQ